MSICGNRLIQTTTRTKMSKISKTLLHTPYRVFTISAISVIFCYLGILETSTLSVSLPQDFDKASTN